MAKEKKELSKGKKIYNIISTIVISLIFVFLLVVVVMIFIQRKTGGDGNIFGYSFYQVVSESMEPTIEKGDVIITKKIKDVNSLKVGDVITFVAPSGQLAGQNETHRIYDIKYKDDGVTIDYIKTAGDNKYGTDSVKVDAWNLNPTYVKAIYVKTSKLITGFKEFIKHWYGYVVCVALPLVVVFVLFIISFVKDKQKLDKQEAEEKVLQSGQASLDNLTEEDKKKLAEEFLKNQNK